MGCESITFDPNNSSKVYASFGGAFGGGAFWVSTNSGTTWTNRSAGLPNHPLTDVVHDGARLLLTGGQLFGSQNVGLFASPDDGVTWTALHDGTWPILVGSDIAIDPNDNNTIYLSSHGAGLYRSTDGGANWSFNVGGTNGMSLNAVRFAPGSSTDIYAGGSSVAVLRSIDAGAVFKLSSVGIGALDVFSVAANPLDIDQLAIAFQGLNNGGIFTSSDAGQNWDLEPVPGTRWNTVRFAPGGTLYAISDGPSSIAPEGVYRRKLDGAWTSLGPDQGALFESELVALRFSQNNPDLILTGGGDFGVAGSEPTVWRSTDAGATWTKTYEGPDDHEDVTDIEFVEDGTDTIMLASFTDFGLDPQTGGLLRSTDGGANWVPSNTGLSSEPQGFALCGSTDDPDTFYYADGDVGVGRGGVFVTTDPGLNWAPAGFVGSLRDIECDPRDGDVLYAMEFIGNRVIKSRDAAATFSPFNTGLGSAGTSRDIFLADGAMPRLYYSSSTGSFSRVLPLVGDMNCDGAFDGADIDVFFDCLVQGNCP